MSKITKAFNSMEFATMDIIIIGLILFLSLKGLVNGFTKELLNFIGLIGGVALASRMNIPVGEFINHNILPITNEPALKLTGFVATLLLVWVLFSFVSSIFDKISSPEVGLFSRILGFAVTFIRYVAIFSLIVVGIQKSEFLTQKFSKNYAESQTFPILSDIGTQLLNITDNNESKTDLNENKIDLNAYKLDSNESNQTQQ